MGTGIGGKRVFAHIHEAEEWQKSQGQGKSPCPWLLVKREQADCPLSNCSQDYPCPQNFLKVFRKVFRKDFLKVFRKITLTNSNTRTFY